jgi:hypothetical protein
MSTFQLDQNIDDRRVVEACSAEGHGEALRLPSALRDLEDPALLAVVMAGNSPLVTLDRCLPRDHSPHIPDANPGIVVVTNYPRRHQTMTSTLALRILAALKGRIPSWHEAPLNNSVLEVTAEGVGVSHVQRGIFVFDGYYEYSDPGWLGNLQAALQVNALRGPRGLSDS